MRAVVLSRSGRARGRDGIVRPLSSVDRGVFDRCLRLIGRSTRMYVRVWSLHDNTPRLTCCWVVRQPRARLRQPACLHPSRQKQQPGTQQTVQSDGFSTTIFQHAPTIDRNAAADPARGRGPCPHTRLGGRRGMSDCARRLRLGTLCWDGDLGFGRGAKRRGRGATRD